MRNLVILLFCAVFSFASEEIVLSAANSFVTTMRSSKDAPIKELIAQAKATIIFPSVKKVGFVVGGMGGDGVMIVGPMSSPSEIVSVGISGGSIGLQFGYEDSSLVLFVMKDSIVYDIKDAKVTIDADVSFSFGDIGRKFNKISDFKFSKDIYAYAANDGFFAGASFGGVVISSKDENLKQSGYAYEQLIGVASKF
ncbi:lipid-binding SYLF domain-containing protein [Campylobacter curvus]|uniref:lipid-binding SYLF domain-containing protein n=1 Tax=Campylobacter curvus TaxID=200 RepID=UPI0014705B29|nr:lipid-binding SYLF domain-containing protein [Campylobacter curvus]